MLRDMPFFRAPPPRFVVLAFSIFVLLCFLYLLGEPHNAFQFTRVGVRNSLVKVDGILKDIHNQTLGVRLILSFSTYLSTWTPAN